ncbi:MAG: universal stress protein [Bacteroidales bacterium]|nr:universal stress protein [Bacteroidales bacterium]
MKNILVPIDFSADSINALEHAIIIANKVGASIKMIHVVKKKNYEAPFVINEFSSTLSNSIEDFFKKIMEKFQKKVKHGIEYKIREGKIFTEICNQAKYDDSYLIIMGTHGVSGFEEKILGSNAYKVVINSPCPIITIRKKYSPCEPKKIILPIDVTKDTRKKVPFVTEFANIFNSEIHVLGVVGTEAASVKKKLTLYTNQTEEYIKARNIKVKKQIIAGNDITASILNYANEQKANLIAIMTEQPNPFTLIMGLTAHNIVNESNIPVMSFSPYLFE